MSGSRIEKDSFGPIEVRPIAVGRTDRALAAFFPHLRRAHAARCVYALTLVKKPRRQ